MVPGQRLTDADVVRVDVLLGDGAAGYLPGRPAARGRHLVAAGAAPGRADPGLGGRLGRGRRRAAGGAARRRHLGLGAHGGVGRRRLRQPARRRARTVGLPTYAGPERVLEAVSVVRVAGEDGVLGASAETRAVHVMVPRRGRARRRRRRRPRRPHHPRAGARRRVGGRVVTSVLTAVTHRLEAEFVQVLEAAPDITLVRRCADVAELLSAGAAGVARVAVVSPDLRGLDRDALRHLAGHGVRVAGLVAADDDEGERRLRQLGVATILRPGATRRRPCRSALVALAAATTSGAPAGHPSTSGRRRGDADAPGPAGDLTSDAATLRRATASARRRRPRVTVVWGPTGAPGRTTVAVTLAAQLAARRRAHPARRPRHLGSQRGPGAGPGRRGSRCGRGGPRLRAGHASTCPVWPGSPPRSCPGCGCSPACRGPTGGPSCGPRRSRTCCGWPAASSTTSSSTSGSRSRTTRS